jgi:hypothetical protein
MLRLSCGVIFDLWRDKRLLEPCYLRFGGRVFSFVVNHLNLQLIDRQTLLAASPLHRVAQAKEQHEHDEQEE